MKLFVLSFSILLLTSSLLLTADDPARGHYQNAIDLMRDGKTQQALDDLVTITKSFPQHELADDALLTLGIFYFEHERNPDQALPYFKQIQTGYAQTNSAPGAYYYLGQ